MPRRTFANEKVIMPPMVKKRRKKKGTTDGIAKILRLKKMVGSNMLTKRNNPTSERKAIIR